jgi:hypothetical protein
MIAIICSFALTNMPLPYAGAYRSTEDGVRALQNDSIGFYLDVGDSDNADEPLSGISQEQAILHVSKLMQVSDEAQR